MSYDHIKYELDGAILTITLNRPEKLNAYTATMGRELEDAFIRADEDDAVRVIIVTGAGRGFCAGADISGGANAFDTKSGSTAMFAGAASSSNAAGREKTASSGKAVGQQKSSQPRRTGGNALDDAVVDADGNGQSIIDQRTDRGDPTDVSARFFDRMEIWGLVGKRPDWWALCGPRQSGSSQQHRGNSPANVRMRDATALAGGAGSSQGWITDRRGGRCVVLHRKWRRGRPGGHSKHHPSEAGGG